MTLATDEFIRRFMLHVLPKGFHRIRHYGLLASAARKANVARIRQLLAVPPPDELAELVVPMDPRPPLSMLRRTHDHHRDLPTREHNRARHRLFHTNRGGDAVTRDNSYQRCVVAHVAPTTRPCLPIGSPAPFRLPIPETPYRQLRAPMAPDLRPDRPRKPLPPDRPGHRRNGQPSHNQIVKSP